MGAAGAALAGSIGQGLQNQALLRYGQTRPGQPGSGEVVSPQTFGALMAMAGLDTSAMPSLQEAIDPRVFNTAFPYIVKARTEQPVAQAGQTPQERGLYAEDITALLQLAGLDVSSDLSLRRPIEPSTFNVLVPYIAEAQRQQAESAQTDQQPLARATPEMVQAGLPEQMTVPQFLDAWKQFHPTEEEPGLAVTLPAPAAETFGLQPDQPVSVDQLGQLGTAARAFGEAGLLPEREEAPLFYYTVEEDDPSRYGQLIDYFPNDLKPGDRIPQQQAEAMLAFAERLQNLEISALNAEQKLLEIKRLDHQWRNASVPVEMAREILESQGIRDPVVLDADGDGKVLWEDLLQQNKDMAELVRTAREIDRIVETTRGISIDNAIKEIEQSYTPQLTSLRVRQLAANTEIDEERARQITEELRLGRGKTQAEINRLIQEIEQGATAFEANMNLLQERIRELRNKNRVSEKEAQALEREASLESLLLEYQIAKAQQEVSPVAAESLWITLGLDGEHSPSGIKLFRGNVEPLVAFLEANSGKVITAKDMFVAAGIDLDQIPQEALEEPIAVDGYVIDKVRTVTGVGVEEEDINEPLDVIIKLANLFSPYLSNDVNAQILAATLGHANPELVASLLASRGSTFVQEMDRLVPGSGKYIEQFLVEAAERALGKLVGSGGSTPDFSPEVMGWAMNAVAEARDPQVAYQITLNNKERLLNDPESPVYQNPLAYEQYLAALKYLAEGGGQ